MPGERGERGEGKARGEGLLAKVRGVINFLAVEWGPPFVEVGGGLAIF